MFTGFHHLLAGYDTKFTTSLKYRTLDVVPKKEDKIGVLSKMVNIPRVLNLDLSANQSAFLLGPRKTGKSTFLKKQFPESITIDFLKTDLFLEYSNYSDLNDEINFWRTKTGLEVDFVLGNGRIAIEVKGTARVDNRDLKPLSSFAKDVS